MMLCPVCARSYEAGTLFCTDDGTPLVADAPVGPPPSASSELDRLLADPAPPPYEPPYVPPPVAHAAAPPARSGGLTAVVAVLGALVVGMLAFVMWQQKKTTDAAAARAEQAEQRAAEAQRSAEEATVAASEAEARARDATEARSAEMTQMRDTGDGTTVWANSPGDGFLALRSGPTTSSGTRLLRIPHGAELVIGDCTPPTTSPGGRYGSWCRAVYDGTAGWVFDAFVSRS